MAKWLNWDKFNLVFWLAAVLESTEITVPSFKLATFAKDQVDKNLRVNLDLLESIWNHTWGRMV